MHLFKDQGLDAVEQSRTAIPVLDLGPVLSGAPGAWEAAAAQLHEAATTVGFFYVANHGVPQSRVDDAFAAAARFHALPIETKLAIRVNENNIGYLPMAGSLFSNSTVHKNTKPNLNESFFITHDRAPDHPGVLAGTPLRSANQWPPQSDGIRAEMTAYFAEMGGLAAMLVRLFALALGKTQDFFDKDFDDEPNATTRFIHYPPQDVLEADLFGAAPHTDNSFLTILARTDVPGLAVRLPSGKWFIPPLIPGTFLVNIGNILRRWSNDTVLSTPHGVLNDSGRDRYSIAYFHNPNPGAVIAAVPGTGAPLHEPAVYQDLAIAFYRANYLHLAKPG